MFAADIQLPCASRARSSLPPHVSFQITAVCENRDPSGPIFPPPLFLKILGKNVRFFPQCPKISRKSWDFHRISLDFSYGLGIFLFFLCIYPKISGILGIAEKSPCLCPKRGLHFCLFPFIMIGQGFSACGEPLLRTNFLPLYSDPCGAFFMS